MGGIFDDETDALLGLKPKAQDAPVAPAPAPAVEKVTEAPVVASTPQEPPPIPVAVQEPPVIRNAEPPPIPITVQETAPRMMEPEPTPHTPARIQDVFIELTGSPVSYVPNTTASDHLVETLSGASERLGRVLAGERPEDVMQEDAPVIGTSRIGDGVPAHVPEVADRPILRIGVDPIAEPETLTDADVEPMDDHAMGLTQRRGETNLVQTPIENGSRIARDSPSHELPDDDVHATRMIPTAELPEEAGVSPDGAVLTPDGYRERRYTTDGHMHIVGTRESPDGVRSGYHRDVPLPADQVRTAPVPIEPIEREEEATAAPEPIGDDPIARSSRIRDAVNAQKERNRSKPASLFSLITATALGVIGIAVGGYYLVTNQMAPSEQPRQETVEVTKKADAPVENTGAFRDAVVEDATDKAADSGPAQATADHGSEVQAVADEAAAQAEDPGKAEQAKLAGRKAVVSATADDADRTPPAKKTKDDAGKARPVERPHGGKAAPDDDLDVDKALELLRTIKSDKAPQSRLQNRSLLRYS